MLAGEELIGWRVAGAGPVAAVAVVVGSSWQEPFRSTVETVLLRWSVSRKWKGLRGRVTRRRADALTA